MAPDNSTVESFDAVIVGGGHDGLAAADGCQVNVNLMLRRLARLHVPHRLQAADPDATGRLTAAVLESLNSVLAEPIQDVVMTDAHVRPCIEAKTTVDLENTLGLTGGNIFHGALGWPFADDALDTPARQWGAATQHDRILLCGSGARRGGAVSGIGGHNAAMAVLAGRS